MGCKTLSLDKYKISATEGEIRTISVLSENSSTVLPIKWRSSDEEIVHIHEIPGVEDGIVINMVKDGNAMVTASTMDGSEAHCDILVKPMVKVDDSTGLNYYFGDLHSHTGFSDGKGTPEIAYTHAKEGGKAHFLAVTDHRKLTNKEWFLTLKHADSFNDGEFVAIPSYEGSSYGEEYIDEFGIKVNNGGEIVYFNTPEAYAFYDIVNKKHYSIGMFAHPQEAGWPTEFIWNSFDNFKDIGPEAKELMRLIEASNETSAYNTLHEYSYPLALDKGWHVSPAAVSDTHHGEWTTNYYCRTVVIAPKLERAYIYDAMRNNRVYATEDSNTILSFKINGRMMGKTLCPDVDIYEFDINVYNPDVNDKIKKIQIISDYGLAVYTQDDFDSNKVNLKIKLQSSTSRYYFVRIVNSEGKRTWSTAIWTGRPADPAENNVKKSRMISKDEWKVMQVSSQKHNSSKNAFDGNVRVGWETTEPSGEIVIDLGREYDIAAIGYYRHLIPYEDKNEIMKLLKDYEFYISTDSKNFGEPAAKGTVRNYGSEVYTSFPMKKGRYVKVKALSSLGGKTVAIGEITVYERDYMA